MTPHEPPAGSLEDRFHALEAERDQLAGALVDARSALRSRDELFAVVVHELRNPLSTIMMGATALLQGDASADPKIQRIRTVAERIHRQSERMTRQIASLSDLAELHAGKLSLNRASHAPAAILGAASELIAPLARERGIGFASPATTLPAIDCDLDRVVQTLANLAGTAIKATPRGGGIEAGLRDDGVFYVLDHAETPSSRPEAALSYTIARGIVEAHGGRIWAAHEPATGNGVYFTI